MSRKTILVAAGVIAVAGAAAAVAAVGDRDQSRFGPRFAERGDGHHGHWRHGRNRGDDTDRMRGDRHGWRGGRRSLTQDEFDTRTRERFARLDKNSDGVVDAAEIEAMLGDGPRRRGRQAGSRMERILARFDANRDGKITKDEFLEPVKKRFARMDLNNDGRITDGDLPPMMRGRDVLKGEGRPMHRTGNRGGMGGLRQLIAADANKDGVITLEEVVAAAGQRFDRFDRNKDGTADKADFDAIQKEMMAYNVQRFLHRYGVDKDGKVTREQFFNAAKERFAQRDVNKDGRLDRNDSRRDHDRRRGMGRRGPGGGDTAPSVPGGKSGPDGPAQKW